MKSLDPKKLDVNRITDGIRGGKYSRREVHAILGAFGFSATMVPLTKGARAQETSVESCGAGAPLVFTWSGYDEVHFHEQYVAEHGCGPNFSFWGDEEEAFAKMRAGFSPDVMAPCTYKIRQWNDAGLLGTIDTSLLSNWDDIIPTLQNVDDSVINGERVFVPMDWGQTSVTFRTDLAPEYVDEENHSWGILWDPKYAGRLSMIDSLIDGVMVAAIYSGAADPFNMTPEEVQKTKDLMTAQRPLLRYYTNDVTSWEQALASGELIAAASWNSTPLNLLQQDIPVAFMNPKEGPMTWTCGISLMSFADPDKVDRAYDLIDAFLAPNTGHFWVESYGMGHSNQKTYEAFSAEELTMRGLPPDDVEGYIKSGIFQATIQNEPELQEMYEEVKAGF
jgi:spermidine/putrescine transport system substrate-binding protein